MNDRAKVIKSLECCTNGTPYCGGCHYVKAKGNCEMELMKAALAVLKEKAPQNIFCPNCGACVEVRSGE